MLHNKVSDVIKLSELGLHFAIPQLKAHLMGLPADDRYKRFYATVSEQFIDQYLSGITLDGRGDAVFVVYDNGGENIVGMCHVAISGTGDTRSAELALSVDPNHRHQHIGIHMLERAILHCRTLGIHNVFMYCLASNKPMQNMARKLNMRVVTDYDESTGTLELASGHIPAVMVEALTTDAIALFDLGCRQAVKTACRMIKFCAPFNKDQS